MAESTGAIVTAMISNLAIAAAKFVGATLTGSASMVAEGVHSIVDTLNQILLLVGLHKATKVADAKHPFGYGREVYFYAFVVALLIFLVGGLYSIYEGVEKIRHPEIIGDVVVLGHRIGALTVNLTILGLAILIEGYSFHVAQAALPRHSGSLLTSIRRSKDPSLFVVLIEDFAALTGLVIAALGVVFSSLLDKPSLDGAASVGIGAVLVGMAFFLMRETHGLLIGEAADPAMVAAIKTAVGEEPSVRHVNEVLTQHFGAADVLVNISLDVDDAATGGAIEAMVGRLDRRLKADHATVRRVFIEIQARAPESTPSDVITQKKD